MEKSINCLHPIIYQRPLYLRLPLQIEQNLQQCIKNGHYVDAAIISFKLKRPQGVYNIARNMSTSELTNFVDGLVETPEGLSALISHIRDWNCFKKYSSVAQKLLAEVIERVQLDQFPQIKEILQGIVVYSEKHFKRAEKLYTEAFIVEHLMNEIALMPNKSNEDQVHKKIKLDIS